MKNLRVVIFGGSGFIGTRLTRRLLQAGADVRIADLVTSEEFPDVSVACDVRNLVEVLEACRGMDVIYNLAAEHVDDVQPPELYHRTNVDGARNVCHAAEMVGVKRIIFTSTVAVYGLPDQEMDETGEPAPFNEYGRSKLEAERVYRQWAGDAGDRCLAIVRPTVVFGVGNRRNFYMLLKQIASNRFVMVGNGRNHKSIAYVDNVAAFLEFVLRYESGVHLFNYVDKPDVDMNTLVATLRTLLGKSPHSNIRLPYWLGYFLGSGCDIVAWLMRRKLPFSAVRVKKFCGNTQFSARKALEAGFVPLVTIKEGLARTVEEEFLRTDGRTATAKQSAAGCDRHEDHPRGACPGTSGERQCLPQEGHTPV